MASCNDNAWGDGRRTATVTPGRYELYAGGVCDDCGDVTENVPFDHPSRGEITLCASCREGCCEEEDDEYDEDEEECDEDNGDWLLILNGVAPCQCPVTPGIRNDHPGCVLCR